MTSYTVAAIVIDLIIICIVLMRAGPGTDGSKIKMFVLFPVLLIISALAYEITAYPISEITPHDISYLTGIRIIGDLTLLAPAYYLVIFSAHFVRVINRRQLKRIYRFLAVPFAAAVVEALLTPKYHLLLYFDGNLRYHAGSAVMIFYISALYCYMFGCYILIRARTSISRQTFMTFIVLIMISLAGMIANARLDLVNFDVFIHSIVCLIALHTIMDEGDMITALKKKNRKIQGLTNQMIMVIVGTIEVKDSYTKGHSSRVAKYSLDISKRLNKDRNELQTIYYAAIIHDVGKIGVPSKIINKPGKLTEEEYNILKQHTTNGAAITKSITALPEIEQVARWHHERYDGKGYPDGLRGEEIPEIARIVSVADAFDAMTSDRVYRKAKPLAEVRNEIMRERGGQFDPDIGDIMLEIIDEKITDEKIMFKRAALQS